jgi:hypothetical protein
MRGNILKRSTAGLRAAELAWALLALFDAGIRLRASGMCLGPLLPADVRLAEGGVERALPRAGFRVRALERRRDRHLREGHDPLCLLVGVPMSAVHSLLRHWGDPRATPFVVSLAEEALGELLEPGASGPHGWSEHIVRETVEHVVSRRITPLPPQPDASEYGDGAAPPSSGVRGPVRVKRRGQMPRFPSKRPASSRSFTWVRKRAASAPSTMR